MSDKKKKLENKYGEIFGYARVSTTQQHEDRQMIALEEYGVDPSHIFLDKFSGKSFNRPHTKRCFVFSEKEISLLLNQSIG